MFSSQRYLASHLQQSACSSLLCNVGMVPSASSIPPSDLGQVRHAPIGGGSVACAPDHQNNIIPIVPHILPLSPLQLPVGDIDSDSCSFPVLSDTVDTDNVTIHSTTSTSTSHPCTTDASTTNINDIETSLPPFDGLSTINANESLNVPAFSDDRLIPMLKLMTAIRTAGAPLSLLDSLVKILKDEEKVGRLDMSNLCTNRTAIRRIQKFFPSLPQPSSATISHERTAQKSHYYQ
jgi:hypothetical protein